MFNKILAHLKIAWLYNLCHVIHVGGSRRLPVGGSFIPSMKKLHFILNDESLKQMSLLKQTFGVSEFCGWWWISILHYTAGLHHLNEIFPSRAQNINQINKSIKETCISTWQLNYIYLHLWYTTTHWNSSVFIWLYTQDVSTLDGEWMVEV